VALIAFLIVGLIVFLIVGLIVFLIVGFGFEFDFGICFGVCFGVDFPWPNDFLTGPLFPIFFPELDDLFE